MRHSLVLLVLLLITPPAKGDTEIYKQQISPHWGKDNTCFWYRNDLADEKMEFVFVDLLAGNRRLAFDHVKLAEALQTAGISNATPERLPIRQLVFDMAGKVVEFRADGKLWRYETNRGHLESISKRRYASGSTVKANRISAVHRSWKQGVETAIIFENNTDRSVHFNWITAEGDRKTYGVLQPGDSFEQHTYAGHVWEVLDSEDRTLAVFEARDTPSLAAIDDAAVELNVDNDIESDPVSSKEREKEDGISPNDSWRATIKKHNVWLQNLKTNETIPLTEDGDSHSFYQRFEWSPDSRVLLAIRSTPHEVPAVYRLESSPKDGGRAKLHQGSYALPGDAFDEYTLHLYDVEQANKISCRLETIKFGEPRIRWETDGHTFSYQQIDRGHQRFRYFEVDALEGKAANVIDERSDTFIWTAHRERLDFPIAHRMKKSRELIYTSEQSGWRQLYLVDCDQPGRLQPITHGEWLVRNIDLIDEDNRQVWFQASGIDADQDPYLLHFCRINFDGSGFTRLTTANGNHSLQFSPNRQWYIDSYSRVDHPPIHDLHRAEDGKFICHLEEADVDAWNRETPFPPQVYSAKGRDGETDIWGVIYRPQNYDSAKKYPVIEDIYAGPHGSFVPKSFSSNDRYAKLHELGFVVVKIDGMGTANRSKKFHDVCWHNLKDSGFPDRIAWIKAAAAMEPALDISRVGIFGTSAGGQSAAAAVIHHPEFYRAAVASCGCHDNRMDKASWNEQWMGYPVGPHYAENSNIENASRLSGKLLLIVGELDNNVPPESTYRFVDALIRADKDFEFLMIPGMGHSDGGAYGQRKLRDFFVKHLQGE